MSKARVALVGDTAELLASSQSAASPPAAHRLEVTDTLPSSHFEILGMPGNCYTNGASDNDHLGLFLEFNCT